MWVWPAGVGLGKAEPIGGVKPSIGGRDGWTDRQPGRWINGWLAREMDRLLDGGMDGGTMDGWMDRRMDGGMMGGWMER